MTRAVEQILELARWAPSGDNTQPWRFEIVSDERVAVHGFDTRNHVIYDFDGHPSHMAHGALLETIRIAATRFGLNATWTIRPESPDTAPIYDVTLAPDPAIVPDPLLESIEKRTVQRRPMKLTPLTPTQRSALAAAAGTEYQVTFVEAFRDRLRVASLLWDNAEIRLTCPEAYPVHRDIIEWGVQFSPDRIPSQALGVDPGTERLMRWIMTSWERVEFFNKYLFGTVAPRIQLDFLPGIFCAAHILLKAIETPKTTADYVRAGTALQRIWLTATHLGLFLQPEMTPVIFRWYAAAGRNLSVVSSINDALQRLAVSFDRIIQDDARNIVFMCRVGMSSTPTARSLRRELPQLLQNSVDTGMRASSLFKPQSMSAFLTH